MVTYLLGLFDGGVQLSEHVFQALVSGEDLLAIGCPLLNDVNSDGVKSVKSVFEQFIKRISYLLRS